MRVGLLGGSFNPAHMGHLHLARTAKRSLGLHKVIWLVSPQNPLKKAGAPSLAERLAQTRKVAGRGMIVSDLESALGSAYTADTLSWLRRRYPGVSFFFLMGTDNLANFHHWRRWRSLASLAQVAVVARPGSTVRGRLAQGGQFLRRSGAARFVEAPLNPASSTALRERAKGQTT